MSQLHQMVLLPAMWIMLGLMAHVYGTAQPKHNDGHRLRDDFYSQQLLMMCVTLARSPARVRMPFIPRWIPYS